MRLYLSSYQIGRRGDVFAALVGGQRRGRVISNALDGYDEERRGADTRRQIEQLAQLGLEATELDLRQHDPDTIAREVGEPDFLWVRGGNVFTARMAMARSGLDELIVEGLRRDAFVYAGFSAGACVLAPSLAGLEQCDPVEDCVAEHGAVRFDGLGILDRPVVPHLESPDHPESALLGKVAAGYSEAGQLFWGLRDGDALVVDGDGDRPRIL